MPSTDQRPPAPPAVQKLVWWFALPFAAGVAGTLLFRIPAVTTWFSVPSIWRAISIPLVFFMPMFISIYVIWKGQQRIRRTVVASGGRACVACVHDLSGLGETGVCPECGRSFDVVADQASWSRVGILK